jgi:hypothetical protein
MPLPNGAHAELLYPYEYNPSMSAHEGLIGAPFAFLRHPIAPAGCRVLTWNSPDTRGTWADHGVEGIYLGPAPDHFRGFRIWVPQHSAMRISGAIWWFFGSYLSENHTALPSGYDEVGIHSIHPPEIAPHPKQMDRTS